jgi:hypothetical protein
MLNRDTAPAPAATISGIAPSTIAAVIIRSGRGARNRKYDCDAREKRRR